MKWSVGCRLLYRFCMLSLLSRIAPRLFLGLALAAFLFGSQQWETSPGSAWAFGVMGLSLAGIAWVRMTERATEEVDRAPLS